MFDRQLNNQWNFLNEICVASGAFTSLYIFFCYADGVVIFFLTFYLAISETPGGFIALSKLYLFFQEWANMIKVNLFFAFKTDVYSRIQDS